METYYLEGFGIACIDGQRFFRFILGVGHMSYSLATNDRQYGTWSLIANPNVMLSIDDYTVTEGDVGFSIDPFEYDVPEAHLVLQDPPRGRLAIRRIHARATLDPSWVEIAIVLEQGLRLMLTDRSGWTVIDQGGQTVSSSARFEADIETRLPSEQRPTITVKPKKKKKTKGAIEHDEYARLRVALDDAEEVKRYAEWLRDRDPTRAIYLQQRLSGDSLSFDDLDKERKAWAKALGLSDPFLEMDFTPLLRRVTLHVGFLDDLAPVLDELPMLSLLVEFPNSDCMSSAEAGEVWALPVFTKVRSLSFRAMKEEMDPTENYQTLLRTYYGDAVLEALCASSRFENLEVLSFCGHEIGARAGLLLATARLPALRKLSIYDERLGDEGAVALAESPVVSNLRSLYLESCQIGVVGARALTRSPHLGKLEELHLRNNAIGREYVDSIRASTALPSLRTLAL
jgi:hypothetical protein